MCAHTHIYTHTLGSECTKVSSSVKAFLCSSTPISPLPWWAGPPSPNALSPPPSWNGYCLGSAFSISNVKSHFSPFLLDIPPLLMPLTPPPLCHAHPEPFEWCGHAPLHILCRLCPPCLWTFWAPPASAVPSHTLPGILTHGCGSSHHPQAHDPPASGFALTCVPRTSYNLKSPTPECMASPSNI